jgi:hypothetical protein
MYFNVVGHLETKYSITFLFQRYTYYGYYFLPGCDAVYVCR